MRAPPRTGMRTMGDTTLRDHLTIVTQLPDFVLGKLDETSLRRVSRHVEICPTCRRELANAMDALGVLAAVSPPPAWVRGAILRRAAAVDLAASRPSHGVTSGSAHSERDFSVQAGHTLESSKSRWRRKPSGRPA